MTGHQRGQVRRDDLGCREPPGAAIALHPRRVGDDRPVGGRLDFERERAFDVGLVEAREHPVRVVAFEVAVQVGVPVERVLEAMQAGAVAHVLRDGGHIDQVLFLEVTELDSPAVERLCRQRLAVELDVLDRGADELDEGRGARLLASERDRGLGDERVVAVGEVQPHVVPRLRHKGGPRPRLLTGEVVTSCYVRTLAVRLGHAQVAALPGRS